MMILVVFRGLPDGGTFHVVDHVMETFQPILFVHLCIGCSFLPLNLRLAATRPSVAEVGADLQTCQLVVNPGACLFKGSSVRMLIFVDIATEDHGAPFSRGQRTIRFAWSFPLDFLIEECSTA